MFYTAVMRSEPDAQGQSPSQLARPASLGKNHTPLIGGAAERAGSFEGFVAFRTRRHLARELQRVLSRPVPVQSIPIG